MASHWQLVPTRMKVSRQMVQLPLAEQAAQPEGQESQPVPAEFNLKPVEHVKHWFTIPVESVLQEVHLSAVSWHWEQEESQVHCLVGLSVVPLGQVRQPAASQVTHSEGQTRQFVPSW